MRYRGGYYGLPVAVGLLVDHGADIDARNSDGDTPLHNTARAFKGADKASPLMERGARVDAINNDGKTPLEVVDSIERNDAVWPINLVLDPNASFDPKEDRDLPAFAVQLSEI